MAVFAMSDLHLASVRNKPMDVFGGNWTNYMTKIEDNWHRTVKGEDTVLVPGDVSWATYLDEAREDFQFLHSLPGRKIISKGNHDYWWNTVKKLNDFNNTHGFDSISFLYNNGFMVENLAICGSRGWKCPGEEDFSPEDEKIYKRELNRFEISCNSIRGKGAEIVVAALHFMPFNNKKEPSEFINIMKKYRVDICVYGHLHGSGTKNAFTGTFEGIKFMLVSADYLNFTPVKIN